MILHQTVNARLTLPFATNRFLYLQFVQKFFPVILAALAIFFAQRASATIDINLQMPLGNPSEAIANTNNHSHYLIQRSIEAIDYNDSLGEPNWASWDLTTNDANGAVARQDSYSADTNLPSGFYHVAANEYSGSGYARGHLCDSEDRTDSTNDNNMTFLMSNMMPQTTANNSVTWKGFEDYCRSLAQTNELLIICGPSGFTSATINTNDHIFIPQYTWKIAVVVPLGAGTATNRITATNRVIAIKVPNTNGVSPTWQNFITSANQIQVDTGLTFFTALAPDIAAALRSKVDGQTNPPPVIFGFSPTNGAAGTNVVITGTNFLNASAVTFNGANAMFNVDSNTHITATIPTNGSSGFISVTTPSGTAISTNNFTVLFNGGTVYSGVLVGWDMSGLTGGLNNYGASPLTPTTNAPNLLTVGLTRGAGVKQSGTAAGGGWGGTGFTNLTESSAVASNQFATFIVTATNGYTVSFSSISRFDYKCSAQGAANGVLQYQVGNGAFNDIMNIAYSSASNGATNSPIDLSGFADLQNVGANTNVTFRIVNYGGTSSSGTWYIFDVAGSSALDFSIQGTVTQIISPYVPSFSSLTFTNNQLQFIVNGTSGANYIVQANTNLISTNWISLTTNAAPFQFTETNINGFSQRFYRAIIAP